MSLWSRIGQGVGRSRLALAIVALTGGLSLFAAIALVRHGRLRVEAADALPPDDPRREELRELARSFAGARAGVTVTVSGPLVRLRSVVPEVARALHRLPAVEVVRWRLERDYFEDHALMFRSLDDLRRYAGYLGENRDDVSSLAASGGTVSDFLGTLSGIIDGRLARPASPARDETLAADVRSLGPLLVVLRRGLTSGADRREVDLGIDHILLRGGFDARVVARAHRELLVADDSWERPGAAAAMIWVATSRTELDPGFSRAFIEEAEAALASLRARFPDVALHLSGDLADYNDRVRALRRDATRHAPWAVLAVAVVLVLGLRAVAPALLLLFLLLQGVVCALLFETLFFGGLGVLAVAGSLAVFGIGAAHGVAFVLAYQGELEAADKERDRGEPEPRQRRLRTVRRALRDSLVAGGTSTAVAMLAAAASFLVLVSPDVLASAGAIVGLGSGPPPAFAPLRHFGAGTASGLVACLALVVIVLPAGLFLIEWVRTHPIVDRSRKLLRSLRRSRAAPRRWILLRGHLRMHMRIDHERRWLRGLATWVVRRRLLVAGAWLLLLGSGAFLAARTRWSTAAADEVLVRGPLDAIRRFHAAMERAGAQVSSIHDYLPQAGEAQEPKLALAADLDRALAGIHPDLPPAWLAFDAAETRRLAASLARSARMLERIHAGASTAPALLAAREQMGVLGMALAAGRPLEPRREWAMQWVAVAPVTLAALAATCRDTADRWLEQEIAPERIAELKRLAREIDALARSGDGVVPRRDLNAIHAVLRGLGVEELAAAAIPGEADDDARPLRVSRAAVIEPHRRLVKLVDDAAIHELAVDDREGFAEAVAVLEAVTDVVSLRARSTVVTYGTAIDRLTAAVSRLRHSLEAVPGATVATAAVGDLEAALHALPPADAAGAVAGLDIVFADELFDRFEALRRSFAGARRPLTVDDVPPEARRFFSDGGSAFLARARGAMGDAAGMAVTLVGFPEAGAGDDVERTFMRALAAIALMLLLALLLLHRSALAAAILAAPAIAGAIGALAALALAGAPLTGLAVLGLPVVASVATYAGIQLFRAYSDGLRRQARAAPEDVVGRVGKSVTLGVLATALPFASLAFSGTPGPPAIGLVVAAGCAASLACVLGLLPALLSLAQDFVVPGIQYANLLYENRRAARLARGVCGRWFHELPSPDPGFSVATMPDGILLLTGRRPPLNLLDAAMACRFQRVVSSFLGDGGLEAMVCVSGLPVHYHVRDANGQLLLDARDRPQKIPAALAEREPPAPGFELVGPVRTFGAGADLALISRNPLNALFTLYGALENAVAMWYAHKPIIFVAEGDMVAGWFEVALHSNYFLVTRHARLGAPEVKLGLTLPFGAHALAFRAGLAVARELMATGELISGEEAVKLGIADGLVPDGEDPYEHAASLCRSVELHDRVRQLSMLRQYGPPLRSLIGKSTRNYVRMLRSSQTQRRIRSFVKMAE